MFSAYGGADHFIFGCGDVKGERKASELQLDIKNGSLYGLTLGMSFEEFIRSDILDRKSLSADGVIQEWDYYEVDAMPDGGIGLCGYPVNIFMYYKGDELYYINMNAMLELVKPTDNYKKIDKIFAEAADTVENSLTDIAGTPHLELRETLGGYIYPKDDDKNAVTEIVYFIKDGKVLDGEVPLTGATDVPEDVFKQTDYDYAIIYYARKASVSATRDEKKLTDAGRIELGIYTKEAITDRPDRDAYFNLKFQEWVSMGSPWKPGIDDVIEHVLN